EKADQLWLQLRLLSTKKPDWTRLSNYMPDPEHCVILLAHMTIQQCMVPEWCEC
ncbi:hypothetical protein K443DRAFT_116657, partial [Laccaria amethystina LaAM-08-1]